MKHLYTLLLCSLFATLAAQEGNTIALEYRDADNNLVVSTMKYSHVHSDRHVYTDGTMFVYWTGLQWTIGTRDFEPYFVTDVDTSPNPPDLASGNWRSVDSETKLVVFSGSGTIDDGDPVKITLTVDANIDCHGDKDGGLTVTVNKGVAKFDYAWSDGSSTLKAVSTSNSLTGLSGGTYGITVTDANGNQAVESVTLAEPDELLANAEVVKEVSCNGGFDGSVSAAATGGGGQYKYAWSFGATTASVSGLEAGDYTVTVTDANGCESIEEVKVIQPDGLSVAVDTKSDVKCNGGNGGSIAIKVAGGTEPYTYAWSNNEAVSTITGLKAGNYTVTVTDASGCTAELKTEITEPDALQATAVVDNQIGCHGSADGAGHVNVSGGTEPYQYAWSNNASAARVTSLAGGSYQVIVTDKNGCTSTATLTIEEPEELKPVLVVTDADCGGAGTASLTVAGGTEPYSFQWSTEETTAAIADLAGGNYSVTVTDAKACSWERDFTVVEPAALDLQLSSTMDSGAGDGTAGVAVTGGHPPYTYAWSTDPESTTAQVSGLTTGIYTIKVTDSLGCSQQAMVKVPLGIPGDACATAIFVDSLLAGAPGVPQVLSPIDNGDFWKGTALPDELDGCFSGTDSLLHPVWFTFTGDGNPYRLSLADCAAGGCLAEADLQAAIFQGTCGDLQVIACNDGVPAGRSSSSLEVATEAGVAYSVVIDGRAGSTGSFQLEMTSMVSTSVHRPLANAVSVYPNPTDGRVRLEGIQPRRVEVFSNLGRLLLRLEAPAPEVDLTALPPGVYTLRMTDRRAETYTARVIRK